MAALRLAAVVIAAVAVAAGAEGAPSPPHFLFEATTARPGDRVTVRTVHRASSSPRLARLYLVRTDIAARVRSSFDSRLHFIGSLRLRRVAPSALTFTVPPLEPGSYAAAFSRGRSFSVLRAVGSRNGLTIATSPGPTDLCPVTIPNGDVPRGVRSDGWAFHGNGLLAASLPATGVHVDRDGDGLASTKMIWVAGGVSGALNVRYRRLDAASPTLVAKTGSGTLMGYAGLSWASRMHFSEGCWKVTGRVRDVSLSFVLEVVRPAGG